MQIEPDKINRPANTGGRLRGSVVVFFLIWWSTICGAFSLLAGWIRSDRMFRMGLGSWSRGVLLVAGVKIELTRAPGLERQPCVFIANHQSALDIPILSVACLKTHDVRFTAKESLFKIPFMGWAIARNGFIPIRRDNARRAVTTFREISSKNSASYSYILFPEGTRSADGRLQEFKRGAIALVLKLNRPLVPVTIIDACRANPKGRLLVRSGVVRVIFHEPIVPDVSAFGGDERALREAMTRRLHETVESALPEEQKPINAV